ncbi:MAG TPA: DUF790 family protein [Ktedonobacterales bacterium]
MLRLGDLRKTTRRSGEGGLRTVYPRFLRDRTLAPRIELAVKYLESMLGRRRRDLDAEVVVQLFGDHKLARCIVACLGESYRYRARTFAELLAPEQCAALAERGIADASSLRLWLYRRVNAELPGFAGAEERAPFLRAAAAELGIAASDVLETLLTLDALVNAILVRSGSQPSSDDVIARYNYATSAALLANASIVRVSLARVPRRPETIRELCRLAGVQGALGGRELVLHGRQDALNNWARNGARLVRLLSALLACGLPARSAEAVVANPTGEDWLFRLDAETLSYLGAHSHGSADDGAVLDGLLMVWQQADALAAEFAALRRSGAVGGWTLRRAAGPLVVAETVLPALFTCARDGLHVPLVVIPPDSMAGEGLARLAGRVPLVALAAGEDAVQVATNDASLPVLRYAERGDTAALPTLLDAAVSGVARKAEEARLGAAIGEALRTGVVTEPRLAHLLGCAEDDVALRVALPAARLARQEPALHYVEGFGLCRGDVLDRAREAAAEVAALRGDAPAGRAWVVRQLGRRLRQVTGASEGIECLIDYLGAA